MMLWHGITTSSWNNTSFDSGTPSARLAETKCHYHTPAPFTINKHGPQKPMVCEICRFSFPQRCMGRFSYACMVSIHSECTVPTFQGLLNMVLDLKIQGSSIHWLVSIPGIDEKNMIDSWQFLSIWIRIREHPMDFKVFFFEMPPSNFTKVCFAIPIFWNGHKGKKFSSLRIGYKKSARTNIGHYVIMSLHDTNPTVLGMGFPNDTTDWPIRSHKSIPSTSHLPSYSFGEIDTSGLEPWWEKPWKTRHPSETRVFHKGLCHKGRIRMLRGVVG